MKGTAADRSAKIARRRYKSIRKQGYPKRWPDEIATEQRWKCFYCKQPMTRSQRTLDHRLPVSRGGKTQRKNLVAACSFCNQRKGSLTDAEFALYLQQKEPLK